MLKNNFKKFPLLIILILGFLTMALPLVNIKAANVQINNPLDADSFTEIFVGVAKWIAGFVGVLAVLMIIIGGFQYMLSGGNEERRRAARQTIQWSLIGLAIVLASASLLNALKAILGA